MSTTTTTTTSNASGSSSEDLYLIQTDINSHIRAQENLYKKLKESEFVLDIDKQSLTNDSNSEHINTANINSRINDLASVGDETSKEVQFQTIINDYFNTYYNENTKLRKQYFERINKLNKKLLDQNEELSKLKPHLKSLETKSSTNYRQLKESKRSLESQKYYKELYTISGFVQLLVIIVLVLGVTRTIPKSTTIMISAILYVLLAVYIVYVVLFTNTDRDVVVFDKYKFPVDKAAVSKCDSSAKAKMAKQKESELSAKLVTLLDERQSKTQCLMSESSTTTTVPVSTQASPTSTNPTSTTSITVA